jgi:hypothetical protein
MFSSTRIMMNSSIPPRFSLRRLLAIVAVVAAVGAIYVEIDGPSPIPRLFGGSGNMTIVREATRVEAYRLAPPAGSRPMEDYISPLDFETASEPIAVPTAMAESLATTLLSADTYQWDTAKACGYPVYGVKLSFFRGNDRVDVFLCFQCRDLAVTRDGQMFGGGDFSRMDRTFVEAVKKLFPDDAEIQPIRE